VVGGIYSKKGDKVRNYFKNNFELICEKVTKNQGKKPLIYMIELL